MSIKAMVSCETCKFNTPGLRANYKCIDCREYRNYIPIHKNQVLEEVDEIRKTQVDISE
jgi:hypothetical protein